MAQCQLESGTSDLARMEDSAWGRAEAAARSVEMREKYFRLPPDKRPGVNILPEIREKIKLLKQTIFCLKGKPLFKKKKSIT